MSSNSSRGATEECAAGEPRETPAADSQVPAEMSSAERDVLLEMLEMYKGMPDLWDKTHPGYTNLLLKHDSLNVLLNVYQKLDKHATVKAMRKKLNEMKRIYFQEAKKVNSSKRKGAGGEVYVSSLWYFDALSFLDATMEPMVKAPPLVERALAALEASSSAAQRIDVAGAAKLSRLPVAQLDTLWRMLLCVSRRKMRVLSLAGDCPSASAGPALTRAEWRALTLALKHQGRSVRAITGEHLSSGMWRSLATLVRLAVRHRVPEPGDSDCHDSDGHDSGDSDGDGGARVAVARRAWERVHADYCRLGLVSSGALLQRRWHELCSLARAALLAFVGQGERQGEGPHRLYQVLAQRFPRVVTAPRLPSWREKVRRGEIIDTLPPPPPAGGAPPAATALTLRDDGNHFSDAGSDDDLIVVERDIETIDLSDGEGDAGGEGTVQAGGCKQQESELLASRKQQMFTAIEDDLASHLRDIGPVHFARPALFADLEAPSQPHLRQLAVRDATNIDAARCHDNAVTVDVGVAPCADRPSALALLRGIDPSRAQIEVSFSDDDCDVRDAPAISRRAAELAPSDPGRVTPRDAPVDAVSVTSRDSGSEGDVKPDVHDSGITEDAVVTCLGRNMKAGTDCHVTKEASPRKVYAAKKRLQPAVSHPPLAELLARPFVPPFLATHRQTDAREPSAGAAATQPKMAATTNVQRETCQSEPKNDDVDVGCSDEESAIDPKLLLPCYVPMPRVDAPRHGPRRPATHATAMDVEDFEDYTHLPSVDLDPPAAAAILTGQAGTVTTSDSPSRDSPSDEDGDLVIDLGRLRRAREREGDGCGGDVTRSPQRPRALSAHAQGLLRACRGVSVVLERLPFGASFGGRGSGGGRVAPRVSLPDIAEVRRVNRLLATAQVAPITPSAPSTPGASHTPTDPPGESGSESDGPPSPPLPALSHHQLRDALAKLASMGGPSSGAGATGGAGGGAEGAPRYCCPARRHVAVSAARRRLHAKRPHHNPAHGHARGKPIHRCPPAECQCCCRALLRRSQLAERLPAEERALQRHVALMLQGRGGRGGKGGKGGRGRDRRKATCAARQATRRGHSVEGDGDPVPPPPRRESERDSANESESIKRPPPPPPADAYGEWVRQRTLAAKYFSFPPLPPERPRAPKAPKPPQAHAVVRGQSAQGHVIVQLVRGPRPAGTPDAVTARASASVTLRTKPATPLPRGAGWSQAPKADPSLVDKRSAPTQSQPVIQQNLIVVSPIQAVASPSQPVVPPIQLKVSPTPPKVSPVPSKASPSSPVIQLRQPLIPVRRPMTSPRSQSVIRVSQPTAPMPTLLNPTIPRRDDRAEAEATFLARGRPAQCRVAAGGRVVPPLPPLLPLGPPAPPSPCKRARHGDVIQLTQIAGRPVAKKLLVIEPSAARPHPSGQRVLVLRPADEAPRPPAPPRPLPPRPAPPQGPILISDVRSLAAPSATVDAHNRRPAEAAKTTTSADGGEDCFQNWETEGRWALVPRAAGQGPPWPPWPPSCAPQPPWRFVRGRDPTALQVLLLYKDNAPIVLANHYLVASERPLSGVDATYWALGAGGAGGGQRLLFGDEAHPVDRRLWAHITSAHRAHRAHQVDRDNMSVSVERERAIEQLSALKHKAPGEGSGGPSWGPEGDGPPPRAPSTVCVGHNIYKKMTDEPLVYAQVLTVVAGLAQCRRLVLGGAPLWLVDARGGRCAPLQASKGGRGLGCLLREPLQDLVHRFNQMTPADPPVHLSH